MIFTCPVCLLEPRQLELLARKDRSFHQCECGRLMYDCIDGSWTFRSFPRILKSREYNVHRLTILQDGSLWLDGLIVDVGREAMVRQFVGRVLASEVLES